MDGIGTIFAALADPTRRAILGRLANGAANVGELTSMFRISQPAISKHLKVLESAGLVSRHQLKQQRLCRVEPEMLVLASAWLGDIARNARTQEGAPVDASPTDSRQSDTSSHARSHSANNSRSGKSQENWSIAPLWSRGNGVDD